MALIIAACGGSGTGDASDATAAPATSSAGSASTQATTVPTTSAAPTTTLPDDGQPNSPSLSWPGVWPDAGPFATYSATTFNGDTVELVASIEYGVEWPGHEGTWDRIMYGAPDDPINTAIYLQRPEPGIVVAGGAVSVDPDQVLTEFFAEPLTIDLRLLPGDLRRVESEVTLEFPGFTDVLGITMDLEIVSTMETIEVPFGVVEGTLHLGVGVSGPFMGGGDFVLQADIWLHPELGLVRWDFPPGLDRLELLSIPGT